MTQTTKTESYIKIPNQNGDGELLAALPGVLDWGTVREDRYSYRTSGTQGSVEYKIAIQARIESSNEWSYDITCAIESKGALIDVGGSNTRDPGKLLTEIAKVRHTIQLNAAGTY